MADISDDLIMMERSAEEERAKLAGLDGEEHAAQWRRWYDASVTFQAAVTAYARETGQARHEVEQAVKKAVRHADEDSAG
ncbi:hypothetical protein [Streptomyces spectabilis]|uniref:Uncharacterized protein YukE n=1 Tax=Streptomyces spectabilis TaxID=68270 RepID=A0A7W8B335_STRST|nr:hypothetical protein [Streptomyces spectabilis]MBB5109443.1 uncharacterized protein YukE [Streptomyces spectabilis]MCI3907792.1 hypothetical protein [Streptomyces spectabilis]GGV53539.1 hypothetical protein GCM10010245_84580 [Streptomyces spectabilis]